MAENLYKGKERRQYKRIRKNFLAKFQIMPEAKQKTTGLWNMVTLQNLGAGGALFNYSEPIAVESVLSLKINFPRSVKPVDCIGRVCRIEEPSHSLISRIAVIFTKINEKDKNVINRTAEEVYAKKPDQIEL